MTIAHIKEPSDDILDDSLAGGLDDSSESGLDDNLNNGSDDGLDNGLEILKYQETEVINLRVY